MARLIAHPALPTADILSAMFPAQSDVTSTDEQFSQSRIAPVVYEPHRGSGSLARIGDLPAHASDDFSTIPVRHDLGTSVSRYTESRHVSRATPLHAVPSHITPAPLQLQPKLTINEPGDKYEQEADRVAEQVMRMPEPSIQRQCACEVSGGECPDCKKRQLSGLSPSAASVQRSAVTPVPQDAPPTVHAVLNTPGQPLDAATRSFFEPRFGRDLSEVRIHTGLAAAQSAADVSAQAYTFGNHIAFGTQQALNSIASRQLLAHEIVHTQQQQTVRTRERILRKPLDTNESPGTSNLTVVIIGSPSPAELSLKHGLQFVHAAVSSGIDKNTVWLVEQTGYDAAGVSADTIASLAGPAKVYWITQESGVSSVLNGFASGSIGEIRVYSHGVPGLVALRYGWSHKGMNDYGMNIVDIQSVTPAVMHTGASISFDSCNTGTSEFLGRNTNLAQETAEHFNVDVKAWTGRTSYRQVNDCPGCPGVRVGPSEAWPTGRRPDLREIGNRVIGKDPETKTFSPTDGGIFLTDFSVAYRLPRSREFEVANNGAVDIHVHNPHLQYRIDQPHEEKAADLYRLSFNLWKVNTFVDESKGVRAIGVDSNDHRLSWSGLELGTYYFEITALDSMPTEAAGSLTVIHSR